jgi:biopolymer transport protein ExbB
MNPKTAQRIKSLSVFCVTLLAFLPGISHAWWNEDWNARKQITVNTDQIGIKDKLDKVPVLVRLHTGDFDFLNAKENGGDIRFVADDDKTPLKYHIEKFDSINEMALIWVQVPALAAGKPAMFWLYSGNPKAVPDDDAKGTYDASQLAVYHFAGADGAPKDISGNGNNASESTAKLDDGSLIGHGATFDGGSTLTILASPTFKIAAAQGYTVSAWIKTAVVQNNAVLFRQKDGAKSLSLGISAGKLVASVGATETPGTADVTPGVWHHVALTAGQVLTVYLDGKEVAHAPIALEDMQGEITVGKGFTGEMDELELSATARPADWIKLEAQGQGPDALLLSYGQDEANKSGGTSYFGTILHSVTVDGWVVIGILMVMAIISWVVMALKAMVIGRVKKANKAFLHDYGKLSLAETAKLDQEENPEEAEIENSQLLIALYGKHDHYQDSTLYRIYHTGMQEIRNRFGNIEVAQQTLTPQAIGSIKASLDATLVRENQKLSSLMVLLTIAISGGPFLGLLGTVVGVMITFAAIAATGDVNVAAIAPGIAAALVATVAGLAVAIPALFGYNYLGSLIKNTSADMHIFVDEFISRITESYSR